MSTLLLLRHAKAARAAGGMRDVDRPLDGTGRAEAHQLGVQMRERRYAPVAIVCSAAARTRETLDCLASYIDTRHATYSEALYSSDTAGYLATIRKASNVQSLLIIGHNPMTEETATSLTIAGASQAHRRLRQGFPTCGLAVLSFSGSLADASAATGELSAFLIPDRVRNA